VDVIQVRDRSAGTVVFVRRLSVLFLGVSDRREAVSLYVLVRDDKF
jgi:hypothetical protein